MKGPTLVLYIDIRNWKDGKDFIMDLKKKIMIGVTALVILLAGVAGTYAFFSSVVDSSKKMTADLSTATLALTFADGDNGISAQLNFGESATKKFKITNTGNAEASLSMDWDQMINTYLNGSLTYTLSECTENCEAADATYTELISKTNVPVSSDPIRQALAGEVSVPKDKTYYYDLTITLNNLEDVDQTSDIGAVFNTRFDVGQPSRYRYYTLTVDPNGGTWGEFNTPQTYQLKNGETQEVTGTPTRDGYTFAGWDVIGAASTLEDGTFTMGISDTIVKAKWAADTYTLTIDANGGEYSGETTRTVGYQETVDVGAPTREGYEFAGWQLSPTDAGEVNNETNMFTMGMSNAKLTAQWTVKSYSYTVVHKKMNVSGSGYTEFETETNTAEYGKPITPAVKNYDGFDAPSLKTITIGTGENKVEYEYVRKQYTLTIELDGGSLSGTSNSIKLYYEATQTINNPTKEGNTFGGWTVSEASSSMSGTTFKMGTNNTTLTATWTANDYNYLVKHNQMNLDGSTYTTHETTDGTAKFGTTVTPNTKTYTGFTSPAKEGLEIKVDTNTPATINVLEYKYARNKYALTIDKDGGTGGTDTQDMFYGASLTLAAPSKTGYTWQRWEKTAGGTDATLSGSSFTMGSGATTVKAIFTVNSYNYTVKHMTMNTDGTSYTLVSADTQNLSANYGTNVTGTPKTTYGAGFGAGVCSSVTIGTDTSANVVECKYPRNKFSLTINPNGGSYNSSTSATTVNNIYYGATHELGAATRTGYSNTWTISGAGASINGSTVTMGTANATVTADWTANTYSVTFNANGGSVSPESKTVTYGSAYGDLPVPTYSGFTFDGWYTASSGGNKITKTSTVETASAHTLYAHWSKAAGTDATLAKLGVTVKTGSPTFTSNATTDEGVYSMADDYGTSYYYRGAVENNYVKFANKYWRIIRVNGDGSLRMIYDGTVAHKNGGGASTFTTTGVDGSTKSEDRYALRGVAWNTTNYNDAKYVGYMYGGANGSASGNKTDAQKNETNTNIKTQLESWYSTNLASYDTYIADTVYCNDRSIPGKSTTGDSWDTGLGYAGNATVYGAYYRFYSTNKTNQPQFTCPQANDMFTKTAQTINGKTTNAKLGQKVGLITADEIVAAGVAPGNNNRNYYLYKSSNYWYWSLSPRDFGSGGADVFCVDDAGYLGGTNVYSTDGAVAPVISLKAEYAAQLTGSGTASSPFQISGVA